MNIEQRAKWLWDLSVKFAKDDRQQYWDKTKKEWVDVQWEDVDEDLKAFIRFEARNVEMAVLEAEINSRMKVLGEIRAIYNGYDFSTDPKITKLIEFTKTMANFVENNDGIAELQKQIEELK